MYIDENFVRNRIVELRNLKKISARDMSLSIGQNENYINEIENGKMLPSLKGLIYICEYFEINLKNFFDTENKNPEIFNKITDKLKKLKYNQLEKLWDFINSFE